MTAPPVRPRQPAAPLRGADWVAARASLALRRTRRFTRWWLTLGGAATVVALLLPVTARDQGVAARSRLDAFVADTLRTGRRLERLVALEAVADSQLVAARADRSRVPLPRPRPAAADPRLPSLDEAIRVARELRTGRAYLALAADPAVSSGPRMQAVADTVARATALLFELPTTDTLARRAAAAIVGRLGITIVAIAEYRRRVIAGEEPEEGAPPVATAAPAFGPAADTIPFAARLTQLRDSVTAARAEHEASLAAMQSDTVVVNGQRRATAALSPGLLLLAGLLAGLAVRLFFAMSREIGSPRIAHALEAERTVGAPVLAVVRDALPDGPMRFKPSGVDPFRVLYLGLTSTGTRTRAMIVTGADGVLNAAVGARLAIAAAADHRATLVADLDTELIALARIFQGPPEPGFSDALAGAFKWREVARSVGSSDGLTITMLSAGTTRDAPPEDDALAAILAEFTKFRNSFEFTIIIASLADLPRALLQVPSSPVVLCGVVGETTVEDFTKQGALLPTPGIRLHGLVLWDAPRPILPSRAELAAHLSKQKGRTPGGSFQAVRKAISESSSGNIKPQ